MPATSERQRHAACVAYAIKKGDTPREYSKSKAVLQMVDSMSLDELRDYCEQSAKK